MVHFIKLLGSSLNNTNMLFTSILKVIELKKSIYLQKFKLRAFLTKIPILWLVSKTAQRARTGPCKRLRDQNENEGNKCDSLLILLHIHALPGVKQP
jgi:hypothetical protein